ncbi:MAG TPA: hypothetical protein VN493_07645 [Thermoanaerobaculia bacterium]|nr:hypothetical protein [Thermoanaerobaculia bacterium]
MSDLTDFPDIPNLDQAPYSEDLRRALYDAVVQLELAEHPEREEDVPAFDPDAGRLTVFYAWGRWFAVWRDLESEETDRLPPSRRWQVVRIQSDPARPAGIVLHEV